MTVNEIKPNMLCLEYRQEESDKDYGSCLWARFNFNLDRYELTITSDCGNYGYKWFETPSIESFLELMARCNAGYILDKIYGSPNIFDYEATKEYAYKIFYLDDEDKTKLDEIFEWLDLSKPESSSEFMMQFEKENDGYFQDTYELPKYRYPSNVLKIVDVFENCIRPKIREIVKAGAVNDD